jgi:hypothetical protein
MLKNKGLYTNSNEFTDDTPQGAMSIAENVVIDKTNIVEPRRGFFNTMSTLNDTDVIEQLFYYDDKLLAHNNADELLYYDSGIWNVYSGTYSVADENLGRMKSARGQSNMYFATSAGIKKLDNYNGTITNAGIAKALDIQGATTGASGFMEDGQQVAYRIVWGFKDANNNLLLGSPSQRAVITSNWGTGSTADIALTFSIPDGVTANYFYQIYRSAMSGSSAIEPNDELQLVIEDNPSAGEITAKEISVTDNTPDSLRGAYLYTSPSQEGILQSNDPPPFAKDLAQFKNNMFYANTKSKYQQDLTMLAVGGTGGLTGDDTVTIAGVAFTAKATESTAACQFKYYTTGSAAQNISDTAQSLVKTINKCPTNTSVYAYYLSGVNDLPGKMLLEARTIAVSQFSTISSRGSVWNPNLTSYVASSNQEFKNYIFWSKTNEFEAVPTLNYTPVGNASDPITRIVPLRESLLIFKDDGIFRLVGEDPSNFFVDTIDSSTILYAPDSAVSLNNLVFALSNQGIISVSDTGVSIISRPIENTLLELFGSSLDAIKKYSFGVNYDTDRKYILFMPESASATHPSTAYVYNYITTAWTEWPLNRSAGIVYPEDDKLYLADADSNYIYKERKSYTLADYVDDTLSRNITVSSSTITIDDTTNVAVGDILYSSSSLYDEIASVSTNTGIITVTQGRTFTTGAVSILKAYTCDIQYAPQIVGNPSALKQFRDASLLFKSKNFYSGQFGFANNFSSSNIYVDVTGSAEDLMWGLFEWGEAGWGGYNFPSAIRTYVPLIMQRSTWIKPRFKIRSGFCDFSLNGYSFNYNEGSETPYRQ